MWRWIEKSLREITALMMVLLAVNVLAHRPSLVVDKFEEWGIGHSWVAGMLLAGAVLVVLVRGAVGFIAGTTPFAIYVLTTVWITLERGGGYPTAIIYSFCYYLLLALYRTCTNGLTGCAHE